jgi:hypothetical protein
MRAKNANRRAATRLIALFIFASATLLPRAVFGGEHLGPHHGHIMTQDGCRYEVVVDQLSQRVDVYATGVSSPIPRQLSLRIERDRQFLDRIDLKLLESNQGTHRYQGSLSPDQQSSIGVGVQFRIEHDSKKRE